MRKLAVFDLDGTLLPHTTSERELFHYLRGQKIIKLRHFARFGLGILHYALRGSFRLAFRNKYYLKGIALKDLEELLPLFCSSQLLPLLSSELLTRMDELRHQGFSIVLLSGSLLPIVQQLQELLNLDEVIGTELEAKEGLLTGRIRGIFPHGPGKVAAFKERCSHTLIDYRASYAFANRGSDRHLLELFGHPVAVHPSRRLARLARPRGWEIIT